MLHGLRLANVHNVHTPRYMKVGTRLLRTDWSLMVFLKRMSANITYKDLRFVVGGSKTALCETFLHMLEYIYTKFCPRLVVVCVCVCTSTNAYEVCWDAHAPPCDEECKILTTYCSQAESRV